MAQDAGAAPAEAPAAKAEGSGDTAQDASAANQQAQAAYERAMAAYDHGDTPAALAAMLESYRLSGRPELLYNLARLQRELHQCGAARASFLAYLQRVPDGRYRDNAEQASRELERECGSADAVKEKPAAPAAGTAAPKTDAAPAQPISTAKQPGYWTTPRVLAWSAISTGVLGGGAALYFYFAARDARDDVAKSVNLETMGGPPWNHARQDVQHRDMRISWVLEAASGALFTGGALVLIVGANASSEHSSASIAVAPGLLEARYSKAF
jgi:hypothetical protein